MTTAAWDDVRRRIESHLAPMTTKQALVVQMPAAPAPEHERRGLFRRKPQAPPVPYVQYATSPEGISAECSGPDNFPVDEATAARIRALGWPGEVNSAGNPEIYSEAGDVAFLAALGADTLRALGATPQDLLYELIQY